LADENGILEQVRSGAPVEFEIDGHKFAIRQMTPTERDRLNYVEVKLRDKIMADYRADGLDKQPVSDELQEMIDLYTASLEQTYQAALAANDQEAAIAAARSLEEAPASWPRSLAQERANTAVKRADRRWALDHLLEGDREEFRRLTAPEPLSHDTVNEALTRWFDLTTFDPNSNGRKQNEQGS
jgi:hypothetical protein